MPVIGHAFVGLAVADTFRPRTGRHPTLDWWAPAAVTLSYAPDIVAHVAGFVGLDWRTPAHSLPAGIPAAALVAIPLAACLSTTYPRALLAAVLCIALHDALDLLQSTDRRVFWPLSDRVIGRETALLPSGAALELALFGGGYGILRVARRTGRRRRGDREHLEPGRRPAHARLSRLAVASVLGCALLTHYLRHVREQDYAEIQSLLRRREYVAVIALADRAERWPSTAKPGRIDYARAEAYAGLGDAEAAEAHYLRACDADPGYFWAIADTAVFYAKADAPDSVRRNRAAPWVSFLDRRFNDHQAYGRVSAKIQRLLEVSGR